MFFTLRTSNSSLTIYLFIYLPNYIPVHVSVFINSTCFSVFLFVRLLVLKNVCLSFYGSIYPFFSFPYLSIYLPFYLLIYRPFLYILYMRVLIFWPITVDESTQQTERDNTLKIHTHAGNIYNQYRDIKAIITLIGIHPPKKNSISNLDLPFLKSSVFIIKI